MPQKYRNNSQYLQHKNTRPISKIKKQVLNNHTCSSIAHRSILFNPFNTMLDDPRAILDDICGVNDTRKPAVH